MFYNFIAFYKIIIDLWIKQLIYEIFEYNQFLSREELAKQLQVHMPMFFVPNLYQFGFFFFLTLLSQFDHHFFFIFTLTLLDVVTVRPATERFAATFSAAMRSTVPLWRVVYCLHRAKLHQKLQADQIRYHTVGSLVPSKILKRRREPRGNLF